MKIGGILRTALYSLSIFITLNTWGGLSLPPTDVNLTVKPGSVSFFQITVAGVPAGYSIANSSYSAWCVDRYNIYNPSADGGKHTATLLDVSDDVLPPSYMDLPWDKIHYLLNHQRGTIDDVQHAIWYFTDALEPDTTLAPLAPDLIEDANLYGSGYIPGPDEVSAALVVWTSPNPEVQGNIIEVPGVPDVGTGTCNDRFTAGGFIFRDGNKVTFGIQGGVKNESLAGGINLIDHGTKMHVKSRTVLSYTALDANCRQATYECTIDGVPGTATVVICDYGEPGRNDVMAITLSNGYMAGQGTTLGGDGPGGGNVQLHKAKCNEAPKAKKNPPGKKPKKPTPRKGGGRR